MNDFFRDFIGNWESVGMNLVITENGSVHYLRYKGSCRKRINGTIKEITGNTFIVKVLWLFSVKFRIDEPPHKAGNSWKMRIDGVELTKT